MQNGWKLTAAAACALMTVGEAQAANYTLNLSGDTSQFGYNHNVSPTATTDQYGLSLSGIDGSNAITVSLGDTIDSTVTLDQAYTIPASVDRTDLVFRLFGSAFPVEDSGVDSTYTFYNGASVVGTYGTSSTTSTGLSAFVPLFAPDNGPLTFTSFTNSMTINELAQPATIDQASFTYTLVAFTPAVPEPSAWAMMIGGLGVVGGAMRRRRRIEALA